MNTPSTTPSEVTVVHTTCGECAVNCGSLVQVRDGVVEIVKPNPDHPGSKGAFCLKGIRGATGLTYSDNAFFIRCAVSENAVKGNGSASPGMKR